ncbi:1,4-alpha-glucan branching protein GlgB [Frateuria defendens]|uniref:1,4-alpha-glucan branching protein GlgB n=1 Tax=Frateuria defendens TaxID=2219559 RepID=UPI0009E29AC1|nr:1,4-alpha-glucan branching protein GlgB [Frateuria defendens]
MGASHGSPPPAPPPALAPPLAALLEARNADPFAVLGLHRHGRKWLLRAIAPGARQVGVLDAGGQLLAVAEREHPDGLFLATLKARPEHYRLRIDWPGWSETVADAYAYGPLLEEADLQAFAEGRVRRPADLLGAHAMALAGVAGVRFAVWAPNARRVSVVGDFNRWDGRRHPMRLRHTGGVWEIFVPGVAPGARYKFELIGAHGEHLPLKADPLARQTERPPAEASVVAAPWRFAWHDEHWLANRAATPAVHAPIAIYEVHALSWQRDERGQMLDWDALAARLVPYVLAQGFTHIELLPVSEHPFGGSWGYQPLGMYAPTARLGPPEAFARFVDTCHVAGIGVIVDWVSAHFPTDAHGLQRFDGTALYEHEDPRKGFHLDWHTLIYNYGRHEVAAYLIGSALEWIERFHIDGLRVDAVASMLYLDYSRAEGEWLPNVHGGRENLEAAGFLRELNQLIARETPGVMVIAEESTAWPGVTAAIADGGLGFDFKWNMGWMHDTLEYMRRDPVHRRYHHGEIGFGLVYAFSERFILPLSHDEVVHGKGSLLARMPGDDWQRFANLRAYFGFMWAHPGKKLLFMGGEFAQRREWDHDGTLDWHLLEHLPHRGMQRLIADLNRVLVEEPALHQLDHRPEGFAWVTHEDAAHSVYAFLRYAEEAAPVLAVSNFTPEPRRGYRVGVPWGGYWRELVNTDSGHYGGANLGNGGGVHTVPVPSHGQSQSLELLLPPLATVLLRAELP